jgi:hypothetical protein
VAVGMLKMIVKMPLLPSVARCAGILMIRIDRVRVLIAIIGMQVFGKCLMFMQFVMYTR